MNTTTNSGAAPLEVTYTLTTDDIYNALKTSKIYRKNRIKALVESIILGGLCGLFGIWWILWDDGNAMIFCIACAVLIAMVWTMVILSIRSKCAKFYTGDQVHLGIYPDRIEVAGGDTVPLNGTVPCRERNKIMILSTGEKEWLLIPMKSVENPDAVRAAITAGTREWAQ